MVWRRTRQTLHAPDGDWAQDTDGPTGQSWYIDIDIDQYTYRQTDRYRKMCMEWRRTSSTTPTRARW